MFINIKMVIIIIVIIMENKALYFSVFINLLVSLLKIFGGIIWNTFTLTIDGIYTISDLVTDVLAILGIKVVRKRANKNHPLGYGRIFYIIELFMGIIALLVGVFVIYFSFKITYQKPPLFIITIILIAVFLKLISAKNLIFTGKKKKSDLLIISGIESKNEAYSSALLIIIIILSQFIPKIDMMGGIIIAIILIWQALKLIWQNIKLLVGTSFNDKDIEKKIRNYVDKYQVINITNLSLMQIGPYYQLIITIKPNKNLKIRQLVHIQNKIKKELKAKTLGLKFISFHLT